MKSSWKRLISLICSITITAQCLPVTALDTGTAEEAALLADAAVSTEPAAETQKDVAGDAAILWEETELREANVKHFRLEGGLMLAAQYPFPVHYQDENGAWVGIRQYPDGRNAYPNGSGGGAGGRGLGFPEHGRLRFDGG